MIDFFSEMHLLVDKGDTNSILVHVCDESLWMEGWTWLRLGGSVFGLGFLRFSYESDNTFEW